MIRIVYMSSATRDADEDALLELLAQCRERNKRKNVTGMLLYRDGAFLQVLEGKAQDVDQIYGAILMDNRNTGHYLIERKEISARQFPDWSMGFRDLTHYRADELEGYSEILEKGKTPEDIPNYKDMAVALLLKF